jgi:2-polyprenyl-3-methyl-5-hydroxy-6-metoxy-1,4-benzoquinol methylase
MDYATYKVEAHIEETHWWFVVRRRLFKSIIFALQLAEDASILEVGTSTGTNLRMLRDSGYRNVRGLDLYEEAIRWCEIKGLGQVDKGDVCHIPANENSYDLVLATDIIEHVDDDVQALREIRRVLKPDAKALITVPAFQSLWGLQDIVSHHKRRYTRKELEKKLLQSGMTIDMSFYFNYLLFLPIWVARQCIRLLKPQLQSENELNSPFINHVLIKLFALDVKTAPWVNPPFGVSLLMVVRKPK